MFQLFLFILSNAVFPFVTIDIGESGEGEDVVNRYSLCLGRIFVYIFSMLVPLFAHLSKITLAYRRKETVNQAYHTTVVCA